MDAWPFNDLALQEGMKILKKLDSRPDGKIMADMGGMETVSRWRIDVWHVMPPTRCDRTILEQIAAVQRLPWFHPFRKPRDHAAPAPLRPTQIPFQPLTIGRRHGFTHFTGRRIKPLFHAGLIVVSAVRIAPRSPAARSSTVEAVSVRRHHHGYGCSITLADEPVMRRFPFIPARCYDKAPCPRAGLAKPRLKVSPRALITGFATAPA